MSFAPFLRQPYLFVTSATNKCFTRLFAFLNALTMIEVIEHVFERIQRAKTKHDPLQISLLTAIADRAVGEV